MSIAKAEHTPLMQQYHEIKDRYPDALLFFQVGDFYELFFADAQRAAAFLGITLTARGKNKGEPIPLCGVPVHAKDHYVAKLIKGGFNVALCDQLEVAVAGTVVKRGVTQVLTPGTLTDSKLLDAKSASYLFSFFPMEDQWGLIFGELMTAQLFATVIKAGDQKLLEAELIRFFPDEIVIPNTKEGKSLQPIFKRAGYCTTPIDFSANAVQEQPEVTAWLNTQFKPSLIEQITHHAALQSALYYFYAYVRRNQQSALEQQYNLTFYKTDDFLIIDPASQRNLELIKNNQGSAQHTLLSAMDGAISSMGSRMIRKWLMRPLVKQEPIEQRFDVVSFFVQEVALAQQMVDLLMIIGDVERVIGRIGLRRALRADFLALKRALRALPSLQHLLEQGSHIPLLAVIRAHIDNFESLYALLDTALHEQETDEWIIKAGFDIGLDSLRDLVMHSNQKIAALERNEQEATGIQSLKVRYNQVHGYYIEITKTNLDQVPAHYIRQQTLVGRERFMTPELQLLQHEILHAQSSIAKTEQEIFDRVKQDVSQYMGSLRRLSHALAHVDALLGFARIAYAQGYVRPTFNEERTIAITQGRHPVVEQMRDQVFIPNDTLLNDAQSLWIITGPNMGGKSTYLRQVALITVMAQCGSFVPAQQANVALIDRIFTRIGAGDDLVKGKSTFFVEMEETATICTQATRNSLIILDEVGRGTTTFDGLAIAQAVVEYIYTTIHARCLFATHYHELTLLHDTFPGIVNYYAASKKSAQGITFLYTIRAGIADGSFGVEVAKLAGMPASVVNRAELILEGLVQKELMGTEVPASDSASSSLIKDLKVQVATLEKEKEAQQGVQYLLAAVDVDNLTPRQALELVWQLKGETGLK
jgi:DNA mismatch repair protein MutS